jgi:hypothetical protein
MRTHRSACSAGQRKEMRIKVSPPLRLRRDISDGLKPAHLETKNILKATKRVSRSYQLEGEDGTTLEGLVEDTKLFVSWNGDLIDIEELGEMCVEEGDRFLRSEGLWT